MPIRVTVWGENVHDQENDVVKGIYPNGMHNTIADFLRKDPEIICKTAILQQEEHGLTEEILETTDVLTWWGHCAHKQVVDEVVNRVQQRILQGMGLIVLHSGHFSKIFGKMLGTTCSLQWREAGETERVWVCNPGHPITKGIKRYFEVPQSEMYGEPFQVPTPEENIFISWFEGGEVFRSGLTYKRGNGKIFYFSPGHETYPIYHQEDIQMVITNAVKWCRPEGDNWFDKFDGKPTDPVIKIDIKGPRLHGDGQSGLR